MVVHRGMFDSETDFIAYTDKIRENTIAGIRAIKAFQAKQQAEDVQKLEQPFTQTPSTPDATNAP